MAIFLRILLPLLLLGGGYWGFTKLSVETVKEERERPPRRKIETEAIPLERTDFRVVLESQGIVRPHNETTLTPRVSGRVVTISPQFEGGAFFHEGEILVELDPTDFLAELSTAEARLARAQASLAQEEARAEQARLDWVDLGYTTEPTDLVLRKPQLKQAKADEKAALASLSEAQRRLERTKIRAPYAGRVKERLIGLGQSVTSNTQLGEIFSTDFAEVRLSLSSRELTYITLPNDPGDPSIPVTLTDALAETNQQTWQGEIIRTEGALDERSRKLFVIARVDHPFATQAGEPPLRIGQPVRARFEGGLIENVFVIPRSSERNPGEVVLIDPEELRLKRQEITPIWSDFENYVIRDGLLEGWFLSTSRLAAAPNGAKVMIIPAKDKATKAAQTPQKIPGA